MWPMSPRGTLYCASVERRPRFNVDEPAQMAMLVKRLVRIGGGALGTHCWMSSESLRMSPSTEPVDGLRRWKSAPASHSLSSGDSATSALSATTGARAKHWMTAVSGQFEYA